GETARDEAVWLAIARGGFERAEQRPRPAEHGQRLDEAGDRNAAIVGDEIRAGGRERWAAESKRLEAGGELAHGAGARAGIQIAGRLSAGEHAPPCHLGGGWSRAAD